MAARLSFDSFDGGGPEYEAIIENTAVLSCVQTREYYNPDHNEMCGSGYAVHLDFTGLQAGQTVVKIECRSPIADNYDELYDAEVNAALEVSLKLRERIELR